MNLRREVFIFMVQICHLLVYGTVSIEQPESQIIGQKLVLKCIISEFTGTASWAKDGSVLSTCTTAFCSPKTYENVTTFSYGMNYIEVTFDTVDSSIFGEWTCTDLTGSESFNVTGSPPTITEPQTTTDETTTDETTTDQTTTDKPTTDETTTDKTTTDEPTTANTNDGSKYIIEIVSGICGLIVIITIIITIIVLVKKRCNSNAIVKTLTRDDSQTKWKFTQNTPAPPEHLAMQNGKPWGHAVNEPRNPEHVYKQNEPPVDYYESNNKDIFI